MRKIKGLILIILTLVFSYFYFLNINVNYPEIAPYLMSSFICIMAYLAYEFYGFPKFNDTPIKVTVIKGIIVIMLLYFLTIYILGIFSGFEHCNFSMLTIVLIISLIATEIFRYIIINANRDCDLVPFLVTLAITIFEISGELNVKMMISTSAFVIYLATIIAPIILNNMILTLYCEHLNIKFAIIYSLIVISYKSIIPIVPKLDEFAYAYADILLSFMILTMSYRIIIKNYEGYSMIGLSDGLNVIDFILFIIFVAFGVLVSGVTPLQIYVANEKVLNVSIDKGDAPVVLKGVNEFDFGEKDIVMYNDEGKLKILPIHEIEEIKSEDKTVKPIRNLYVLDYKNDPYQIDNKKIYGKVLFDIKFIFKPSLKVKDYLSGGVS